MVWSGDFVAGERLGFELWEALGYSEPARLRDQFTGRKRPKDSNRHQPENQNKTQNIDETTKNAIRPVADAVNFRDQPTGAVNRRVVEPGPKAL